MPYDDRAFTPDGGTWRSPSGRAGAYLDTLRASGQPGARLLRAPVFGSRLQLVAEMCPTCGKVRIVLDGRDEFVVDTYAPTVRHRQVVWVSRAFTQVEWHLLRLFVLGTPKRADVRVDGLVARR